MWLYSQSSGKLWNPAGACVGHGYAGRGDGKNNPAMQQVQMQGPLPCGLYTIGPAHTHPHLGPVCMDLTPDPSNQMFGRSLFRLHADSIDHPGAASDGCIVMSRPIRELVAASPDRVLKVVA